MVEFHNLKGALQWGSVRPDYTRGGQSLSRASRTGVWLSVAVVDVDKLRVVAVFPLTKDVPLAPFCVALMRCYICFAFLGVAIRGCCFFRLGLSKKAMSSFRLKFPRSSAFFFVSRDA